MRLTALAGGALALATTSTLAVAAIAENGFEFDLVQISIATRNDFMFVDGVDLYNESPHTLGGMSMHTSSDPRVEPIRVTSMVENIGNLRRVSYVIETISGAPFADPAIYDELEPGNTGFIEFAIREITGAVNDDDFVSAGTTTRRLFADDGSEITGFTSSSNGFFSVSYGIGLSGGRNPLDPVDFGGAPARLEYVTEYTVVPAPAPLAGFGLVGLAALRRRR